MLRKQADFIEAIYHGIRTIVPVLAIAFFMGQFVNYFQYTGLDRMLAYAGGSLLVQADLPVPLLIVLFVLLVVLGDFAMSGMLSKFGVLAPIFIPMFMMVGMSPGIHHGGLPHRRQRGEHHHATEQLPAHHPGGTAEVQEEAALAA